LRQRGQPFLRLAGEPAFGPAREVRLERLGGLAGAAPLGQHLSGGERGRFAFGQRRERRGDLAVGADRPVGVGFDQPGLGEEQLALGALAR
jgi:hypothetical protein